MASMMKKMFLNFYAMLIEFYIYDDYLVQKNSLFFNLYKDLFGLFDKIMFFLLIYLFNYTFLW